MTRRDLVNNFIDNLEIERARMQLTQEQMARKLEMSTSNYKKIISHDTEKMDIYTAYLMYHLTGKLLCEMCGEREPVMENLRRMKVLSNSQLDFIRNIVDFEIEFAKITGSEGEIEDFTTMMIPVGNVEDGMIWDSVNVKKINVAQYRKKFGSELHCAIQITSNHLHPVYMKGDVLLVSRRAPRDGDTGIFIKKETGRAYLRRFLQTNPCQLVPINELGETFYVNPDNAEDMSKWIKYGIVLTKMREHS